MILQPWHPPYYRERIEAHGYGKTMDLLMWKLEMGELKQGDRFADAIHAVADKVESEHGITVRNMRKSDLEAEIGRFMEVYNAAWERNWGFVPITDEEVALPGQEPEAGHRRALGVHRRARRRGARRRVHASGHQPGDEEDERTPAPPRLAQVPAREEEDRPGPRLRPRGQARVPAHRDRRPASTSATSRPPPRPGPPAARQGWILETNEPMNRAMEGMGGKIVKRYRLYEKPL